MSRRKILLYSSTGRGAHRIWCGRLPVYSTESYSYIDALDFSSPAKLAEYLHSLDSNEELYLDYLEWKSNYRVEAGVEQMARHAFCDLCAKLNQDDEPEKVYDSMASYWSPLTQCKSGWSV